MILATPRCILLICALMAALSAAARADPITIKFTAEIGSSNNIDTQDVFGEGYRANLASQIITGSVSIDPASLTQRCGPGGEDAPMRDRCERDGWVAGGQPNTGRRVGRRRS